jgi:hypothetical protein
MKLKTLNLKFALTIELTMSIVGALAFFSVFSIIMIQNLATMMNKIITVVMGAALVGRMVPGSMLLDIAPIG